MENAACSIDLDKKVLLLVDDEEGFTRLLKLNLERGGRYEVHCRNDAFEVVEAVRSLKPDAVLLDVVMPGLDGGEVAKRIKSDPEIQNTPVIMLTATIDNAESGGGAVRTRTGRIFFGKPVDLASLVQCLEEVT